MAKTKSKQPQTLPKAVSKTQKSKLQIKDIEPAVEPVAKKVDEGSGSDSDEEDSDEDDIDEACMKKIIDLLGDDGLDEFAQYQLGVLGGQGSEEDDDTGSNEESPDIQRDSGSEDGAPDKPIDPSREEDIGDNENEDAAVTQDSVDSEIDLEGLSEVGEDVVPRQQLKYMNNVRTFISVGKNWAYILLPRTLWSEYAKTLSWTLVSLGPRPSSLQIQRLSRWM